MDMNTEEKNIRVVDEKGNIHICDISQKVGEGGQGIVLRTMHDKNTAIKLQLAPKLEEGKLSIAERVIKAPEKIAEMKEFMQRLGNYPIHADLPLTMPLAALKTHAGYVMRLLDGVKLLTDLMVSFSVNRIEILELPKWMEKYTEGMSKDELWDVKILAFYKDTGGLGRRLRILRDVADALAKLHAVNLVFGDLNPKNVLVAPAELLDEKSAWLIDVDNICHEGESAAVSMALYRSPEMFAGSSGASAASDIYSFAILAFELLVTQHPFDGKIAVENEEIPEAECPWIYDKDDRSNFGPQMLDSLVKARISPALFALFAATFEEGQNSPRKRPPLSFWREAFTTMLDQLLECPKCGNDWVWSNSPQMCPFCDEPAPEILTLRHAGKLLFAGSWESGKPINLPLRLFAPARDLPDKTALIITRMEDGSASLQFWPIAAFCNENGEIKNCLIQQEELFHGLNLKMKTQAAWQVQLRVEAKCDED